ncbi:MAG TPA: UDP-3-O-acyl-N-acetylglucosamine deacetylase, partial [Rhizomicrobium sp.]|nr:UDP-3-O-acyl-N-acetylglucosamine deacetylase [Rhizomicrobium sp.]
MTPRRTVAHPVTATGTALHAGVPVTMTLSPAAAGSGIVFRRADLNVDIPARYDLVRETRLGTVIGDGSAKIGVVEHLMAAAAGGEIDDLLVTLNGPEPPILDGDALSYLSLLESAGIKEHVQPRTVIKVLRPVTVESGDATASLLPDDDRSYSYELSFPVIGEQFYAFAFSRAGFKAEIAPARTFGFLSELDALNKMDLAKGCVPCQYPGPGRDRCGQPRAPAFRRRIRPPQDSGRYRRP